MQIIDDLSQIHLDKDTILTIGAFDGVHRGHQYLIGQLLKKARHTHRLAGLITFHPHPNAVLSPRNPTRYITTPGEKAALLERLGLDIVAILPFNQEIAQTLKEMGCYYILFGIESGSQHVLDSLDKGIKVEQTRAAFELCRKYGFRTHAYVLLASPEETAESLRLTEELVDEVKPDTVHISICTPLVGTYLMEDCQNKGLINWKDFADHDYYLKRTQTGKLPLELPELTYDEVLASRARILDRRRRRFFFYNLRELKNDFLRDPSIQKFIFRYSFYRKMRHYFG